MEEQTGWASPLICIYLSQVFCKRSMCSCLPGLQTGEETGESREQCLCDFARREGDKQGKELLKWKKAKISGRVACQHGDTLGTEIKVLENRWESGNVRTKICIVLSRCRVSGYTETFNGPVIACAAARINTILIFPL